MLKKMLNQNGRPRPPAVDGIKFFYNDDQAAKRHCWLKLVAGNSNVLWPGYYCQKF